jgi:methylenetetrahydrofolate dehydrogenase (NADP+)/methenyltetrahydrofolate cyclohydrolase
MSARIIDGSALADALKRQTAAGVAALTGRGKGVRLVAMIVGGTPAGDLYAERQGQACRAVGIDYQLLSLPADISQRDLKHQIRQLNADPAVTGIMMHLPLPDHLDRARLQYEIDVVKDVEGVNPANIGYVVYGHTLIAPCTAAGVIELIESTGTQLRGAEAVVVGASEIVGKPVALLLAERMATVTVCHIATHDVAAHTRRADVLVVAVGKPGLITPEHVKPGAVVIDVGINRVTMVDGTKKTVGDVAFDTVKEIAGWITPVPGGVGPMTVAMLLRNTLRSSQILHGVAADR